MSGLAWWEWDEFVAADVLELTNQEKEELGKNLVAFLEVIGARRILHCLEVSLDDLEECLKDDLLTPVDMEIRRTVIRSRKILLGIQRKILASIERKRVE